MTSTPTSRIVWPPAALAGCVFCAIVRDTRGIALGHADRFNFFPASPLCCLTWLLDGDCHLVTSPSQMDDPAKAPPIPRLAFSGAQLGPLVSWNPGATSAIAVGFYPDAFAAITRLDLSCLAGRFVPAADVLPEPMLQVCVSVLDIALRAGIDPALASLQEALAARWSAIRPGQSKPGRWLLDWTRSVAVRATFSNAGLGARQAARRIKSWTGVSERDLKTLAHTEQLYAHLHAARADNQPDWASLAASSGFSDQAHMIRRLRQHTGFTPEQLRRHARSAEAFWCYRLLGEHFDRPADDESN